MSLIHFYNWEPFLIFLGIVIDIHCVDVPIFRNNPVVEGLLYLLFLTFWKCEKSSIKMLLTLSAYLSWTIIPLL